MEDRFWMVVLATLLASLVGAWLLVKRKPLPPSSQHEASRNTESSGLTYRIRGLPASYDLEQLHTRLSIFFPEHEDNSQTFIVKSLAAAATSSEGLVATVDVSLNSSKFKIESKRQWTCSLSNHNDEFQSHNLPNVTVDTHFLGLTPLYTARTTNVDGTAPGGMDIIAVSGLGSHAFGSFKERGGHYMWLRDSLGDRFPLSNVWVYGFDSTVHKSKSVQNIDDLASAFEPSLLAVMHSATRQSGPAQTSPASRRLILIGHSLGGLIIKQTLIRLNQQSESNSEISRSLCGLIFFGVPNQGMAYHSLLSMCEGGPNEPLLRTLMPNSEVIRTQQKLFGQCAIKRSCEIHCFYETKVSPTAVQDSAGEWRMRGPEELLVTRESALHHFEGGPSDNSLTAIDASHSEMVKFREHDHMAENVFHVIAKIGTSQFSKARFVQSLDETAPRISQYEVGLHISNAPYLEESLFTGRAAEIEALARALSPQGENMGQKIVALSGLGGMGKTQLALAFARRYQSRFTAIIWMNCKSESSLRKDITAFVTEILTPGDHLTDSLDAPEKETIIKFLSWLSESGNHRWLMILDNYDNPLLGFDTGPDAYDIKKYFPRKSQGSILITTRSTKLPYKAMSQLQQLSDVDSKSLLLQKSRRTLQNEEIADFDQLVSRLGGLPLALATAGDYLSQAHISFAKYLHFYDRSWQSMTDTQLYDYEDRTLYTTWRLSLQLLDPQAVRLMRFLAYFDNHDIWFGLIHQASKLGADPQLSEIIDDEICFIQNMRKLQAFSLVESHQSNGNYSLHTCVHEWALNYLNAELDHSLYRLAVRCVSNSYVLEVTPSYWNENKRLFPHLLRLLHSRCREVLEQDPALIDGNDYYIAGRLCLDQDKLDEAEEMYMQSLYSYEKALGPDDTSTVSIVMSLGNLYRHQGKLYTAEKMQTRALQVNEKVRGPHHPITLRNVYNLGNLYFDQDKLDKAELMYMRALQGYEGMFEPSDAVVLDTINNLGLVYSARGKSDEAEQMFVRALQGYETKLGPSHITTLNTVNNLGMVYRAQGKPVEAEQMHVRALQGFEKELGPHHPFTCRAICNLAVLYGRQGKLDKAEQISLQALQGADASVGANRVWALHTIHNLGTLYQIQGKLGEAKQMYMRALEGYEQSPELEHVSIQQSRRALKKVELEIAKASDMG